MYDPQRAYDEGFAEKLRSLEAEKKAWETINFPESRFHVSMIDARIFDLKKLERHEVIQHAIKQMRFWGPQSKQLIFHFKCTVEPGSIL